MVIWVITFIVIAVRALVFGQITALARGRISVFAFPVVRLSRDLLSTLRRDLLSTLRRRRRRRRDMLVTCHTINWANFTQWPSVHRTANGSVVRATFAGLTIGKVIINIHYLEAVILQVMAVPRAFLAGFRAHVPQPYVIALHFIGAQVRVRMPILNRNERFALA